MERLRGSHAHMSGSVRLVIGGASLAALISLAACGGTSTGTSSSSESSSSQSSRSTGGGGGANLAACTAVSQSDAATLTGDPNVQSLSGGSAQSAGASTCIYADLGSANGGGNGAVIVVEPVPGAVSAQVLQAALAAQAKGGGGNYQQESGIGDAAYSSTQDHQGDLVFAKGGTLVVIAVTASGKSGTDILSAIKSLASNIVSQL